MKVFVKTLYGKKFEFDVDPTSTILSLKRQIDPAEAADLRQVFVYAGKVLENNHTMADYHFSDGTTISCIDRHPV